MFLTSEWSIVYAINAKTGEETTIANSEDGPFAALAFKIMTDPFVGSLTFARIYSGKLSSGSSVVNTVKNQKEVIEAVVFDAKRHRADAVSYFSSNTDSVTF